MNSAIAVSVLMPVYNAREYVAEAIRSILNQTFDAFELIVIDDASTDGSTQIILSFRDPRIRYFRNTENRHISRSLNRAIGEARGRYIARMDADDIALPHRLQTQFDFMQHHPQVDICGSWVEFFGDRKYTWKPPVTHETIRAWALFANPMIHPTIFAKRTFFERNTYDAAFDGAEDYALWVQAIDEAVFANVAEVLLRYRFHDRQISTAKREEQRRLRLRLLNMMLQRLGIQAGPEELKRHFEVMRRGETGDLSAFDEWFFTLMKYNRQSGYFDREAFESVLAMLRWEWLNDQTSQGWRLLLGAYRSTWMRLSEYSPKAHLRFILKCLMKYRRS